MIARLSPAKALDQLKSFGHGTRGVLLKWLVEPPGPKDFVSFFKEASGGHYLLIQNDGISPDRPRSMVPVLGVNLRT
jgi:hypothetical protein